MCVMTDSKILKKRVCVLVLPSLGWPLNMASFTQWGLIISLNRDRVLQIHFRSTSMGEGNVGKSDFQRGTESQSSRAADSVHATGYLFSMQASHSPKLQLEWPFQYTYMILLPPLFEIFHCCPIGLMILVKPNSVASKDASLPDPHIYLSFLQVSESISSRDPLLPPWLG